MVFRSGRMTLGVLVAAASAALAVVASMGDDQPLPAEALARKSGTPLAAQRSSASVAPFAAYSSRPFTFECLALVRSRSGFNILVANEDKPSATHWELFTWPDTGALTAYLPGFAPDHVRTQRDIGDGRWHTIGFVLEDRRARLYVDGRLEADQAMTPPARPGAAGPMAFGSLVNGEIGCNGLILRPRLSAGVREIDGVPAEPWQADAATIGLWDFGAAVDGGFADLSANRRPAVSKATQENGLWPNNFLGGETSEFRPMPPREPVAAQRALMANAIRRLGLTSVTSEQIRDGVLRDWLLQYRLNGAREYPEAVWIKPTDLARQTLDAQALPQPGDTGPFSVALRRTRALVRNLARPGGVAKAREAADLDILAAAHEQAKPATGSEADRALYLALCAVRRRVALSNPLLGDAPLLFAARGTYEGSVRSNPGTSDVQGGHFATQYFGFNAWPGGGLYLVKDLRSPTPRIVDVVASSLVQNGRLKGKRLVGGSFATPDLSFDGRAIVFAWTANKEHRWAFNRETCFHLFRVNVDGSNLTQLTDGPFDDFDPCWLPDRRIAFVSERRGGYIRCFGNVPVRNFTLFSIRPDGTGLLPLSYFETDEWNPSVSNDGRLLYTRWDYTDRENCLGTRLWIAGADGTDARSPHGNYPLPFSTLDGNQPWKVVNGAPLRDSRLGSPLVEMGMRAIPGSRKIIVTAAPHHGQAFGSLCLLDLSVPDDGHMSQVKRITPDELFPESELPGRRHYKYGTPWPLSEDFYLCNIWEDLFLVDRYGNRELLCEIDLLPCQQDERLRLVDPIPVRQRVRPPAVGPRTRPLSPAKAAAKATVAVINVYDADLPLPKGAKVKWLRVTQNTLKENHLMGAPMVGYERENTPRIPLGIVPVEADGSVYFEAPVAKQLIFQALDENYMAVHSMRACASVQPGEQLRCQGCHESPRKAPKPYGVPAALRRAPSKLRPELGVVEPISYYRQIKPIIERSCAPCHARAGKGPADIGYEALRDKTFWFSGAMWTDMNGPYSGTHGGSRTIPGRFGARASVIGKALLDATHRNAVSAADRHAFIVWLDSNSLRLGAYTDEERQLKGELIWPVLDVDPANAQGVEGSGAPLRRNFWHENHFGPYKLLVAEHAHDRVVLMDEAGAVKREWKVPHPQDAWLLPSGNLITTHVRGVRELRPDSSLVWEYKVEAPNEVPSLQMLPNGNALIGVVGLCRLLEVERPSGRIVHTVQLATSVAEPHAQFRMCRQTPEGTYLVPFTAEGIVREVDRDGKVLREWPPAPMPVCALRLPNGNTLISANGAVTEYAPDLAIVWRVDKEWLADIDVAVPAGIQRLPNGNTVICNWNTQGAVGKDAAHVIEVTPDKRVVWQVNNAAIGQVAQCQLLDDRWLPRTDPIR